MTDLRKAAEMALEALEGNCTNPVADPEQAQKEDRAIQALREALADDALDRMVAENQKLGLYDDQPIHEPVAWMKPSGLVSPYKHGSYQIPLYTAPPISDYHEGWEEGFKAAKREWVSLTDEDYEKLLETKDWGGSLIQAVELKLKEKNGF